MSPNCTYRKNIHSSVCSKIARTSFTHAQNSLICVIEAESMCRKNRFIVHCFFSRANKPSWQIFCHFWPSRPGTVLGTALYKATSNNFKGSDQLCPLILQVKRLGVVKMYQVEKPERKLKNISADDSPAGYCYTSFKHDGFDKIELDEKDTDVYEQRRNPRRSWWIVFHLQASN